MMHKKLPRITYIASNSHNHSTLKYIMSRMILEGIDLLCDMYTFKIPKRKEA